jgi:antirestriction protein ArdC
MNNHEVYTKITARIMAAINQGIVPWAKPYVGAGLPRNASSGRRYSGINVWATLWEGIANDYTSCGWLTFKQALDLKLVVNKGQKATPILFMSKVMPKKANGTPTTELRPYFMARAYSVFNLDRPYVAPQPRPDHPLWQCGVCSRGTGGGVGCGVPGPPLRV